MQEKVGKRSWVNIVIIVFLIILLVLTFFSNTIRNRNLSECTTATVGYGTIDSKVRGSGTVSAKESYELKASDTRKVKSVLVNNGQTVTAGEVLLILEAGESSELAEEEETLRQMQLAYQRSVISAFSADYTVQNRAIEETQTAIDEAVAARDAMNYRPESVSEHKTNLDTAIANRDKAQSEYDEAYEKLTNLGPLDPGNDADSAVWKSAKERREKAETALATAKVTYGDKSEKVEALASDRVYASEMEVVFSYKQGNNRDNYVNNRISVYLPILVREFNTSGGHPYYAAYSSKYSSELYEKMQDNLIEGKSDDIKDEFDYAGLLNFAVEKMAEKVETEDFSDFRKLNGYDEATTEGKRQIIIEKILPSYYDDIAKACKNTPYQAFYDAYNVGNSKENNADWEAFKEIVYARIIRDNRDEYEKKESAEAKKAFVEDIFAEEEAKERKNNHENLIYEEAEKYKDSTLGEAYEAVKYAEDELAQAKKDEDAARADYYNNSSNGNASEYKKLESTVNSKKSILDTAKKDVETKQAAYDLALEKKAEYDGYADTITQLQKTLEDQIFNLEQQQKADGKTQTLEWLDINEQKRKIDEQQEKVDELKAAEGEEGETEIKAPVSGVIREISIAPGNKTSPDGIILKIEIKDMGYSLSFSVTNEQAKLIRKGDTGELTNMWWGGNIYAEVTDIKSDPQNPRTNKMIYFSVTGDVSDGETLDLSVGRRSAEFDSVVPKAALKSDNNGDFVYVVNLKSSPLGNRYIAERVSVEVVARDDKNVAVSGALDYGAYVVVNSSLPISNGSQVRLAGQ